METKKLKLLKDKMQRSKKGPKLCQSITLVKVKFTHGNNP